MASSSSNAISSTSTSDELPEDIVNLISDIRNSSKIKSENGYPTPTMSVSMQVAADTTVRSPQSLSPTIESKQDPTSASYSSIKNIVSQSHSYGMSETSPKNKSAKRPKDSQHDLGAGSRKLYNVEDLF